MCSGTARIISIVTGGSGARAARQDSCGENVIAVSREARLVERAVLEPGGIVSFSGKKPAPEDMRHREVLERLDQLMGQLRSLRPAQ